MLVDSISHPLPEELGRKVYGDCCNNYLERTIQTSNVSQIAKDISRASVCDRLELIQLQIELKHHLVGHLAVRIAVLETQFVILLFRKLQLLEIWPIASRAFIFCFNSFGVFVIIVFECGINLGKKLFGSVPIFRFETNL